MAGFLKVLRWANVLSGAALILLGFGFYVFSRALIPLLLAIALAAVGPVEDLLNRYLKLPGIPDEQTKDLVNQGTSLILIVLLLVVLFLSLAN